MELGVRLERLLPVPSVPVVLSELSVIPEPSVMPEPSGISPSLGAVSVGASVVGIVVASVVGMVVGAVVAWVVGTVVTEGSVTVSFFLRQPVRATRESTRIRAIRVYFFMINLLKFLISLLLSPVFRRLHRKKRAILLF